MKYCNKKILYCMNMFEKKSRRKCYDLLSILLEMVFTELIDDITRSINDM